ncbi:MAG: tRNA pseudouridine32 synthase/23S rRNA pseudouridine746 synthase, partial [Chitinophagales bacterium]
MKLDKNISCFVVFDEDVNTIELPEKFTFPFLYVPHDLTKIAAKQLQSHLESQSEWVHNFGLDLGIEGQVIGKMFGVLVVHNEQGKLGFLQAFSGKLADSNHHSGFVPPVFDMLTDGSFFQVETEVVNNLTIEIKALEEAYVFLRLKQELSDLEKESKVVIEEKRWANQEAKKTRKALRISQKEVLEESDFVVLTEKLNRESVQIKNDFRRMTQDYTERIKHKREALAPFELVIEQLKEKRKNLSNACQNKLFEKYAFLNGEGESKHLKEIFENTNQLKPPAGAGECAAPKLLQYAYLNNLVPIAMAEFWWGDAPDSQIRKHKLFYPACTGKCQPILDHMLKGIEHDENPMLINQGKDVDYTVVYEDDYIAVVNKPIELLSVPGVNVFDSVQTRFQARNPKATGPLMVHRLDMSTSGLLLITKDKDSHKALQQQFIKRTIEKRYVALLDGKLELESGEIQLPLRPDMEDRPRQLVCQEHGKKARTKWNIKERIGDRTKVYFHPITGRTHQLRIHSAHPLGLDTAIVGDDLYGTAENRLCL